MEILRLNNLLDKLKDREAIARAASKASAITGYTAGYALFVHENMTIWPPGMRLKGQPRDPSKGKMTTKSGANKGKKVWKSGEFWDPQGQAQPKFLEQPTRQLLADGTLAKIITNALKSGATLVQALVMACMRIQRESMELVPVDTGNLRASAFTKAE